MINSEGKESAGIGSASLECLIQSRLHYIVEKENYITKDVYVDVGVEDTTINVVLTPKTKKTLTVNATPDNALIVFTDKPSNVIIAQGTGTLTYETYDPRDILIQVGASGYETYEERITLDENIIRDITLTALPVEQGAVSLTVVDSETKAKIAAYVYDKDTGGILGQVTKDTPLQLTGDVNTSRILRFVSSGYIEVEQLVTYAIPTAEVTVEMDKVPVQTGTIYATAVNTESTALDGVTFEYKLSTESSWKPLGNDESTTGKSEAVTAPVGTSVNFRASKTGYITNTGTGTINSTGEHSVIIVLKELPPEPEEVSVTIKAYEIYDDNKLYLAADIKEISITGTTVGTTRPDEPLVITRNKGSVITYYALTLSSDWYNIGHEEVVFDTDKTVEILCLRNNDGLIKVRTRDALTGCMTNNTIYDETGKKIGNCDLSENGYVREANPIGFERYYKTLGDNRYEDTEPIMFIADEPSEAVVNYIDLHPKEGQDYIALKFIDSVTKAPITTGISCWFNSSVKTIVTDYQGIAHISGTYDSKVVILVRRDGYTEYNQSYDSLANHSVTTIELVPEPTTKQYYIHAVTEESVNITTGVHGYLWNNNSWVEQTLQGGAMGFAYTGEPGTSIRVKFTATGYNDIEKDIVLEDGSTEPIDVKVVMTEETPPQPTTKEYFVFAVTEKNAPVETVTAASVLVDDEWIPQDLRTVVANIGFNYTAIPGTVIKVKFVATGFITEEINVTLQTESDESLIVPVTLRFEDGIDYMQIEGDGIEYPIFRVGNVESN